MFGATAFFGSIRSWRSLAFFGSTRSLACGALFGSNCFISSDHTSNVGGKGQKTHENGNRPHSWLQSCTTDVERRHPSSQANETLSRPKREEGYAHTGDDDGRGAPAVRARMSARSLEVGDLVLDGLLGNLAEVGALELTANADKLLAERVLGRGVDHLVLNVRRVGDPERVAASASEG